MSCFVGRNYFSDKSGFLSTRCKRLFRTCHRCHFVQQWFDCRLECRAMLLTENLLTNAPVAVNYESSWHARNAAKFVRDAVTVEQNCIVQLHLLLKCLDLIRR